MVQTILVTDYTSSGFTHEDAEKISEILKAKLVNLSAEDTIRVDFSNVKFFTTLFFNIAFASLLKEMSFEEYEKKIILDNLSDVGRIAYKNSIDNARRFYSTSENEHTIRNKIIAEILADE
jgi:hypothetical protein